MAELSFRQEPVLVSDAHWQPASFRAPSRTVGSAGYVARVRPSSRIAFGFAWGVFTLTVSLAWRKVMSVPDGRGDVTGLTVATVAGAFGLALVGVWVQERERDR
jgi:hypothetical protein